MKHYKATVDASFTVNVEAASRAEAERIIDGVLNHATSLIVFENTSQTEDHLESAGPFTFKRGTVGATP